MFAAAGAWIVGKGLKYILSGLVIAAIIGGLAWKWHDFKSDLIEKGRVEGRAEIQALWDKDTQDREKAFAALQADYRTKEQAYNARIVKLQQDKAHEVARINTSLQLALDSLRDRPYKRAAPPDPATFTADSEGGTGAGLARPDAEFLAGYAASAAQLDSELNFCIESHNAAVETINSLSHPSGPP